MHYISTKKVREHDIRPRFDEDTHDQIVQIVTERDAQELEREIERTH